MMDNEMSFAFFCHSIFLSALPCWRFAALLVATLVFVLAGCGETSASKHRVVAAGAAPGEERLMDVNGGPLWPAADSKTKAIALIFVLADCPICNAYLPELNRLHEA